MYALKKLAKLHQMLKMIKEYNQLILQNGTSKDVICKSKEIKYKNIINQFHRNISMWDNQGTNIKKLI